jgi:hypothetical protein
VCTGKNEIDADAAELLIRAVTGLAMLSMPLITPRAGQRQGKGEGREEEEGRGQEGRGEGQG